MKHNCHEMPTWGEHQNLTSGNLKKILSALPLCGVSSQFCRHEFISSTHNPFLKLETTHSLHIHWIHWLSEWHSRRCKALTQPHPMKIHSMLYSQRRLLSQCNLVTCPKHLLTTCIYLILLSVSQKKRTTHEYTNTSSLIHSRDPLNL